MTPQAAPAGQEAGWVQPVQAGGMTISHVLARVGPGLIRPLTTSAGSLARVVTGVCIYDDVIEADSRPGELLLAVGVEPTPEAVALVVEYAAGRDLPGVVLRGARGLDPALAMRADGWDVALLAAPATPWVHLATILRAAVVSGGPASSARPDGPVLGDLFAFATDVAVRVGGAVTIEDPSYRVLAYSSIHGEVDEPRKQTILGRAVPRSFVSLLQKRGVLQALRSTDDVVKTEPVPELGLGPRWTVGIRAAGEFLGSLWVAESGGPLSEDCVAILQEAAGTAALHLLYHRLELQADQSRTQDVGRELLAGGTPADLLATSAGLRLQDTHWVIVLEAQEAVPARVRLARAVTTYCATLGRRVVVVEEGPRVYVIVSAPGPGTPDVSTALRIAADAARHAARATGLQVLASVGCLAATPRDIVVSRRQADSALRVLRHGMVERHVVAHADVRSQVTLLDLVDLVRERVELREGKVQALVEADGGGDLVATLSAYLDCLGDVRVAAARLGVHPNTFRYRLRRLQERVGLDLSDPSERIVAAIQLRALPPR
ncbi:helix-turn-helix domain-containing protein [Pseudonocardia aurantiaca]|uniref:PucR family transcriptional regulator n=1 Tax=Pseudonocardia aurantiaca TaxID=75290 RepID=A0ABW4FI42_9PSEU